MGLNAVDKTGSKLDISVKDELTIALKFPRRRRRL